MVTRARTVTSYEFILFLIFVLSGAAVARVAPKSSTPISVISFFF